MGGGSKKQTVGYKYYAGVHMVLCHGPIDKITRMEVGDKLLWTGVLRSGSLSVSKEDLFGGEKREGGISGTLDFLPGDGAQGQNDYLVSQLGNKIPSFRGVASIVLRKMYLSMNPYLKTWKFRAQRIYVRQDGLPQWYQSRAEIGLLGLFDRRQRFLIALDRSTSMDEIISGSTSRFDLVKAQTIDALNYIETLIPDSDYPIDIAIVGWSGSRTTISRDDVDAADMTALRNFVNGLTTVGDGTYFNQPFEYANTYFNAGISAEHRNVMVFITDGQPTGTSADTAVSIAANMLNRTGVFSGGNEVDVFAANVDYSDTTQTERIVNTDNGVPNISSGGDETITSVMLGALSQFSAMNPAHIIRECLTDATWGMGYNDGDLNAASFIKAANTLYAERMGMSLIWDTQTSIEDFVKLILQHIDAVIYVDRKTGLYNIKLIRGDYDEAELLLFDESNIDKIENFKRPAFGELCNSVSVSYWSFQTGETATVTIQDIALAQEQQGGEINTSVTYEGFCDAETASRVAQRDLRSLSTPLITCDIYTTSAGRNLNIGDAFKMTWPDYGVSEVVMRVTGIAYGNGKSRRVRITCAQDVFGYPEDAFVSKPSSGWKDPTGSPTPPQVEMVMEMPYFELVRAQGSGPVESALQANPYVGYVGGAACPPVASAINATLYTDPGDGYDAAGEIDFCAGAFLAEDIDAEQTTFTLYGILNADEIEVGDWFQIGDELLGVAAIADDEITVLRGVLDTIPEPHFTDDPVLFWDGQASMDPTEYIVSDVVNAKITTANGSGEYPLLNAEEHTVNIVGRAYRPFPPSNVKVNGQYWPEGTTLDLTITWGTRNRIVQTGGSLISWYAGDVIAEEGTTYNCRVYDDVSDTLIDELTDTTEQTFTVASALFSGVTRVRIEVESVRDGFTSWKPVVVITDYSDASNLLQFTEGTADPGDNVQLQFEE